MYSLGQINTMELLFFLISETLQKMNVDNSGSKRALTEDDKLRCIRASW